ncbi:MAG: ferredoxin--NADP reductase [Phycisphaerae bacterium]
MSETTLNATVVARHDYNEALAVFRIRPDSGTIPHFESGQFATIGLPREETTEPITLKDGRVIPSKQRVRMIRRAYSIASSPKDREGLDLYIVLVETGKLTPALFKLQVGSRLWLDDQIKGEFTLESVPPGNNLVAVSTGTGLAPFVSMMRTFRGTGFWKRFIIVNGCRYARDLGYVDEFDRVCKEDPTVSFYPIVTREPEDSPYKGLRGRVTKLVDDEHWVPTTGLRLNPADTHVLLCGNPDMINDIQAALEKKGFTLYDKKSNPTGNIHFERYW